MDAYLEWGVKSTSLSGGWERPWRSHCGRTRPGSLGPCLDLVRFRQLQTRRGGSFSRERVLRALGGESLLLLSQGCILSCRSCRPELSCGSSDPIVSFRFTGACPLSEPKIWGVRFHGLGPRDLTVATASGRPPLSEYKRRRDAKACPGM